MKLEDHPWFEKNIRDQIKQGDILKDIQLSYRSFTEEGEAGADFMYTYSVVLTQICDLDQHYQRKDDDKKIDVLLICPAYPVEQFLEGAHIEGLTMQNFKASAKLEGKTRERLKKNVELVRYHFLEGVDDYMPELVIDFKRFHTIPIDFVQNNLNDNYLLSLKHLFRERLSQRFSNYLSRIGLPENIDEEIIA